MYLLLLLCFPTGFLLVNRSDLANWQASEEFSAEDFSQACSDYDRISPLDPSKTSLLLKAKKVITDQAGDGDVDLS